MDVNKIIVCIMACFAVIGAIDRIIGNKLGFGKKFEEGFMAMGPLALAMIGILTLAPVIAKVLGPIVVPVFKLVGADPAMFAGTFLAIDMGGAPLAKAMCLSQDAYLLGGLIVGSMLGATIVFTIPVAFELAGGEKKFLAKGILIGMITIPIGCFIGGLTAGFSVIMLIKNLIPVTVVALLIAFGMWKWQNRIIKIFIIFGKFIMIIATVGLALGIVESLTGVVIIKGMAPIGDAFSIVANVVIVLAGAFPLVYFITKVLNRPLAILGKKMGINHWLLQAL